MREVRNGINHSLATQDIEKREEGALSGDMCAMCQRVR